MGAEKSTLLLYPLNLIWIVPAEGMGVKRKERLFLPILNERWVFFTLEVNLTQHVYRILDANFNRAREGLRVVEEMARFILNDAGLAGRLKSLRHNLRIIVQRTLPEGTEKFLGARDSKGDVGLLCQEEKEFDRFNYTGILLANFKRVQEALRVMEEYCKIFSDGAEFKKIRYEVYDLEKETTGRLIESRFDSRKNLVDYSLYVIVQEEFSCGRSLEELTSAAIEGGAKVIQLRDKESSTRKLIEAARKLRLLTKEKGIVFIVNDRIDVALAAQADGAHLGQDDLPASDARKILGRDKIIGISVNTLEQAREAQQQGADYIGVGPVFETGTKDVEYDPVGVDLLKEMAKEIHIPKVAIGGITSGNAFEVVRSGADGVAVVTAVISAPDVAAAASSLRVEVEKARAAMKS